MALGGHFKRFFLHSEIANLKKQTRKPQIAQAKLQREILTKELQRQKQRLANLRKNSEKDDFLFDVDVGAENDRINHQVKKVCTDCNQLAHLHGNGNCILSQNKMDEYVMVEERYYL
jgi:hypothetical protein